MKRLILIAMLLLPALYACTDNPGSGSEGATSVVISQDKADLQVGETLTLSATVLPESLGMGVVWSATDTTIVSVKDGLVTAKAEGVTYVVATAKVGIKKAACMVSVNPPVRYSVTVRDELGRPITEVNGYPGMRLPLRAVTSDGESGHSFTWSVEDAAAGSITPEGVLTLGAAASPDVAYIYDTQSYVKVVSEDGCGCRIPIRSSMLRGIQMGEQYQPAGLPILVLRSESYPISVLYQGSFGLEAIPVSGLTLELSNPVDFTLERDADGYSLLTGTAMEVSTKLNVSVPGNTERTEIAEFKIEKYYPITAQLAGRSSSTLSFTWTEGDVEKDVKQPYTVSLYKDAACTELELSYDIPADDGCWKSRQPKFVFSGLTPDTDYWFRVKDTAASGEEEVASAIIHGTTEAFHNVLVSSEPAAVDEVLLAEDFGQLCWGADEISMAAGIDVADDGVGYNTDTKKSFTDRTAAMFVGTTGQYAQRSLTAQAVAKKEAGVRFAKWAQGQYARIYIGPGYLFLSTSSYGTHIITPELTNIREGKIATLKITLHAAGKLSGGEAALAVQRGKTFSEISSGTQTNKNKLDLSSNVETITFNGGITNLEGFEVTIDGVVKGDRIAFGPTAETNTGNSNMMILSDMTITLVELQ